MSCGKSSVTAIVSGTSRPSFSEKTPPDMYAADGSGRSSTPMIQAIWWTKFSAQFPPENSQNRRQLMSLKPSKGRSERPLRKAVQSTFCAVQSEGTGRTHCPLPCGVLRLIQDSTCVTLPTHPSLIHCLASVSAPELWCCNPICTTRSDALAAARHLSASGIDQVIVFSE